ncbi:uncharacterized protein LOC143188505 [Calliopsis andreniformis]|uniref:uncharacterized protein LOC143188505 n=1 Tax=Calliopsis andreniformis TaxID=337506 RepID=UPI003FCC6E14
MLLNYFNEKLSLIKFCQLKHFFSKSVTKSIRNNKQAKLINNIRIFFDFGTNFSRLSHCAPSRRPPEKGSPIRDKHVPQHSRSGVRYRSQKKEWLILKAIRTQGNALRAQSAALELLTKSHYRGRVHSL